MHVVYIHQYFTTPDQKGGTRSYEMARRLIQAGHRVTMIGGTTDLIGVDASPGDVQAETVDGIDVQRILEPYSNTMSFGRRWIAFLKFARKAYKVIKTIKNVDVVLATSTPLTVADPGRKAARFHKCPFIFEVRDLWPELPIAMGLVGNPLLRWYLKRMELRAYKAAARIIALAPGIKQGICQTGYREQNVAMIPNSSDVDLFIPTQSRQQVDNDPCFGTPGDFRLVFTGAHGLANGLDAVLDAIGVLKARDVTGVRFVFIGTGGLKPHLQSRAEAEDLDDYISWVDPIKKTELAQVLPQMDVGMMILKNVSAFYRGTSPNKFFDYLACGLPVLNNYPGWIAENIQQNDCGMVVEPDNPEAFADTVVDLTNRRDELPAMSKNSRKLAETVFNRDILGKQFVQVLEDVHASS